MDDSGLAADEGLQLGSAAAAPINRFPASFGVQAYGALLREHYDFIQELLDDPSGLDPELIGELQLHHRPEATLRVSSKRSSSPSSSERKHVCFPPPLPPSSERNHVHFPPPSPPSSERSRIHFPPPSPPQASSQKPASQAPATMLRLPFTPTQASASSSDTKFSFSEGFLLSSGLPSLGTPDPLGGDVSEHPPPSLPALSAPAASTKADRRRLRNASYKLNPPPHVRAKKAERFKKKLESRQEQAVVQPLPVSISETKRRGEWTVVRKKGKEKGAYRVVGAGDSWPDTLSARLVDISGRLIGYRAFGSLWSISINNLCMSAVAHLDLSMRIQFGGSHSRGTHSVRLFMIHRTQVEAPCHNAFMIQNLPGALEFAKAVAPVIEFAEVSSQSITTTAFDPSSLSSTILPFPSPSTTYNDNFWGTFCCIIPFGHFDWRKSAFLVIHIDGEEDIAFELPPGVPFFLPSAVLAHYNTEIVGDLDIRGSLVLWTSGKVFQWLAQGGRAVKQLSQAELRDWLVGAQGRWLEVLGRYPFV
ncbi:hypothetical protein M407DRAFT_30973 [Tulasnella calospora MUT 4182]|uniref:Uncharacterized protein n=1 Tax=Tulasnella calospora MUT 4182 TaxID=1051891 RepID=A0A0C3LD79_9AGAM|nr:hypothetical protein M407DRAFT_30973 [Tulasnella calospora MUT 4182]